MRNRTSLTASATGTSPVSASFSYDPIYELTQVVANTTTATTGTAPNLFRYTGREFDSETGAYYYRARYYCPCTGRFFSEDPIGFEGGVSFYRYALNNPSNWTDPTGPQRAVAYGAAGAGMAARKPPGAPGNPSRERERAGGC